MYKATANGEQFLSRTAMHSTKGSRKGFDLLDQGVNVTEVLTDEQRRASLQAAWKRLNEQIIALPKKSPERRKLGLKIQEIGQQIHAIRPKLKGGGVAKDHFISVAKERLPKAVFSAIMTEAAKRAGRTLLFRADVDGTDFKEVVEAVQ